MLTFCCFVCSSPATRPVKFASIHRMSIHPVSASAAVLRQDALINIRAKAGMQMCSNFYTRHATPADPARFSTELLFHVRVSSTIHNSHTPCAFSKNVTSVKGWWTHHLGQDAVQCVRELVALWLGCRCSAGGFCLATASRAGMIASKAFSDVSCVLTWLGMPLRRRGDDMMTFVKLPAVAP